VHRNLVEALAAFGALALEAQLAARQRQLDAAGPIARSQGHGPERVAHGRAGRAHDTRAGFRNHLLVRRELSLHELHAETKARGVEERTLTRLDQPELRILICLERLVAQP